METLTWQAAYSVGIPQIDSQHKKLIELINQLIDNRDATVDSEVISDVLYAMLDYTRFHFASEENYMQAYGYPGYDEHQTQHLTFVRRVAELSMDAVEKKDNLPDELLRYLKDWLIEHILQEDMKYKPFFEGYNIS